MFFLMVALGRGSSGFGFWTARFLRHSCEIVFSTCGRVEASALTNVRDGPFTTVSGSRCNVSALSLAGSKSKPEGFLDLAHVHGVSRRSV